MYVKHNTNGKIIIIIRICVIALLRTVKFVLRYEYKDDDFNTG